MPETASYCGSESKRRSPAIVTCLVYNYNNEMILSLKPFRTFNNHHQKELLLNVHRANFSLTILYIKI